VVSSADEVGSRNCTSKRAGMGGAASLLRKKEPEDAEGGTGAEQSDENAGDEKHDTAKPSVFKAGLASLRKKANQLQNKAFAKLGLAIEEEDSPDDEDDAQNVTQNKGGGTGVSRIGSQVFLSVFLGCAGLCFYAL
jgi:hypothetical protein